MPGEISVTVRLFASLREDAGASRVEIRLPKGSPAGAVWAHLPAALAETVPPAGLRYAVNDQWTLPAALLADGDEIALILPVSGG